MIKPMASERCRCRYCRANEPTLLDNLRDAIYLDKDYKHPVNSYWFWLKVHPRGDDMQSCWDWQRAKDGQVDVIEGGKRRRIRCEIIAWELSTGTRLDPRQKVLRYCETKMCVNPHHLYLEKVTISPETKEYLKKMGAKYNASSQ